jgi:hypothetical protein
VEIFASLGVPLVSTTLVENLPPVSNDTGVNCIDGKFVTGINKSVGKFATSTAGVVDTGGK